MLKEKEYFDANQRLWDAKTRIHLTSAFYDMKNFMSTRNSLNQLETELLGDVKGQTILHSQCHFGQDTLSLQAKGAQCTGFDFSSVAIAEAKKLNQKLGLEAHFIESNIYELDQNLQEKFDIVFTSYGVITWLPDLDRWAYQLASRLKEGGRFIMVEFHPTLYLFDWNTSQVAYTYFNNQIPTREVEQGTYADREAELELEEFFWQHPISQVLQSLMDHGIKIVSFRESNYSPYNLFNESASKEKGRYEFKVNGIAIPCVFAIEGVKES